MEEWRNGGAVVEAMEAVEDWWRNGGGTVEAVEERCSGTAEAVAVEERWKQWRNGGSGGGTVGAMEEDK